LPDDRLKRGHRVLEASMELEADGRCASLFLLLRWALKIIVFPTMNGSVPNMNRMFIKNFS
jgi:hypothetical protein